MVALLAVTSLPMRHPPEVIRDMAREIVTNRAFVTADVDEARLAFAFFFGLWDWSDVDLHAVGAFYGEFGAAVGGVTINGMPTFTAMRLLHRDDVTALAAEMRRMREALE